MENSRYRRQENPFFYLKCLSGVFFGFSLLATICAGILFGEVQTTARGLSPEEMETLAAAGGVPQGLAFSLSVVGALGTLLVAGVVFTFASLSERALADRVTER